MKGICPVCDTRVTLHKNTEESEIISCPDCKTRLVVEKIKENKILFQQAPAVEEDWGE